MIQYYKGPFRPFGWDVAYFKFTDQISVNTYNPAVFVWIPKDETCDGEWKETDIRKDKLTLVTDTSELMLELL